VGDLLIVRDGLKPGERVIVDGVQKARPGSKVNPSLAATGSAAAPARPAAAASTAPAAGK
jgi:membrane fusion protein (multidrug efflux system)